MDGEQHIRDGLYAFTQNVSTQIRLISVEEIDIFFSACKEETSH